MKRAIVILLVLFAAPAPSQDAAKHLATVTGELSKVESLRRAYAIAFTEGASPLAAEKRRRALLTGTARAITKVSRMKPLAGDSSVRDSMLRYLTITFACANEEFVGVADMETISELSFDAMESYLLAREHAFRTLEASARSLNACVVRFADRHGVTLKRDRDADRPRAAAFRNYNKIYGIFFECYKQEAYLLEAIAREDIAGVEQNRRALARSAEMAVAELNSMKDDAAGLAAPCRDLLDFYIAESGALEGASAYLAETDNFARVKTVFQSLDPAPASVELFLGLLVELGKKEQALTSSLSTLAARRAQLMQSWNESCAGYLATAQTR